MKVVAVSYLNTVPMIYGITHAAPKYLRDALVLCPPASCAAALADGSADIALIPVATLKTIPNSHIITDYCISASDRVETVALLSDTPLNDIHTIYLDAHSRTSVQLVRILAREKWQITPKYIDNIPEELTAGEAMVAIGDKVFEIEKRYSQKVDLAYEWQQHTGLPFVFAVWATCKNIDQQIVKELNDALAHGVRNVPLSVPWDENRQRNLRYLTHNIEFTLNASKTEAINLFLSKI